MSAKPEGADRPDFATSGRASPVQLLLPDASYHAHTSIQFECWPRAAAAETQPADRTLYMFSLEDIYGDRMYTNASMSGCLRAYTMHVSSPASPCSTRATSHTQSLATAMRLHGKYSNYLSRKSKCLEAKNIHYFHAVVAFKTVIHHPLHAIINRLHVRRLQASVRANKRWRLNLPVKCALQCGWHLRRYIAAYLPRHLVSVKKSVAWRPCQPS